MIGTTIDQYRIEARLGGGGMGEVFRARDLELDRDVAIKLVRPELSDLEEVTARFRAEARTLAGLAHSNIATVFRFFPHEGTLYLVMEYISGKPFGDMLRDTGAQPATDVVRMLKQALAGLGYAHENMVVHRDIKPGNLMVDGHNTVKVLDFGIAHLLDQTRITQSGSVLGTPAYMAPEQVLGQQVDGRTDLYALGVVLFEMLTGKLPFRANSQFELMRAHLETQPRSLDEMSGTVPRPLQETIVRALSKNADDRFQSAAEFSKALDVALAEAESEGLGSSATVAAARRSSVAVASSPVKTEARSPDTPTTLARPETANVDTEVRTPTSLEIPLPEPKTAAGAAVAAVLLAGAGIWWLAGSDDTDNRQALAAGTGGNSTLAESAPTYDSVDESVDEASSSAPSTFGSDLSPESSAAQRQPVSNGVTSKSLASNTTGQTPAQKVASQTSLAPKTTSSTASRPAVAAPKAAAPVRSVSLSGYQVRATKVSAHERQGTGRLSRAAGYNGSFALSVPPGGQAIQIDELVEVYRDGRRLTRQLLHSQVRKAGRFKTKQRIPGLKELTPGSYKMRLVFESEGRRLGMYEWTLIVSG